jgi:hypothetical protein
MLRCNAQWHLCSFFPSLLPRPEKLLDYNIDLASQSLALAPSARLNLSASCSGLAFGRLGIGGWAGNTPGDWSWAAAASTPAVTTCCARVHSSGSCCQR